MYMGTVFIVSNALAMVSGVVWWLALLVLAGMAILKGRTGVAALFVAMVVLHGLSMSVHAANTFLWVSFESDWTRQLPFLAQSVLNLLQLIALVGVVHQLFFVAKQP